MSSIFSGRYTSSIDGEFIVFIIGMRVNRMFAIHKWMPVMAAMAPMVKELYQHPKLGFLGHESFIMWRGVTLIQYWRSYEDLEKYARGGIHLEAWKNFNRKVGTDGTVGIYHETYRVPSGHYECIYGNMPRFGLGKIGNHAPATGRMETARRRMGGDNEPAVDTPVNPT